MPLTVAGLGGVLEFVGGPLFAATGAGVGVAGEEVVGEVVVGEVVEVVVGEGVVLPGEGVVLPGERAITPTVGRTRLGIEAEEVVAELLDPSPAQAARPNAASEPNTRLRMCGRAAQADFVITLPR